MPPPSPRLSNQHVGNAGLYWTCFQLTLLGWNVMPTSRNARGIDILACSDDGLVKVAIQVKTLSRRSPVPLGEHLEHLYADVVVVVRHVATQPEVFLLTPEEVKALVHRGEKDGRVSYWLQPAAYERAEFKSRWDKVTPRPVATTEAPTVSESARPPA